MIDLANYRPLLEQFTTLREELAKFSPKLADSSYAVALTRCDSLPSEDVATMTREFIDALGLPLSQKSHFGFDSALGYFEQGDLEDDTIDYDAAEPFFVAPISAVAKINIEPLKFALYQMVKHKR